MTSLARRIYDRLPPDTRRSIRRVRYGESAAQRSLLRRGRSVGVRLGRDRGVGDLVTGPLLRPQRVEVVDSFDAWHHIDQLRRSVSGALEAANIPLVILPDHAGRVPTIVVSAADRERTIAAMRGHVDADRWWVRLPRRSGVRVIRHLSEVPDEGDAFLVAEFFRFLAAPTGRILANSSLSVRVEFWRESLPDEPRPDGGVFAPGTLVAAHRNRIVSYLEPDAWERAAASPTKWLDDAPHLFEVDEPIDVVYTWVDGADPAWLERKTRWQPGRAARLSADALLEARFLSRDELRYSLRSLEMYANWVRHIYLVTDQQVPPWLDTANPRITVVDHRDIFRDREALPVFNSHAIESQLHHIDGLSERYIYMNDDVFFTRRVRPEQFFHGNGLLKFFPSTAVLDVAPRRKRDVAVLAAAKNNRALLLRDFGRIVTNKMKHTPHPQSRALLREMEERYPDDFDRVMRSRFRSADDVAIASAFAMYYGYATGRAVPDRISYGYLDLSAPTAPGTLEGWLRNRPFDVICLNDTADDPATAAQRDRLIDDFLSSYFPLTSRFERSTSREPSGEPLGP